MTEQKEIRAKSLEIAVAITGAFTDASLQRYLPLAAKIADYINAAPQDATGGTVGKAPVHGV